MDDVTDQLGADVVGDCLRDDFTDSCGDENLRISQVHEPKREILDHTMSRPCL